MALAKKVKPEKNWESFSIFVNAYMVFSYHQDFRYCNAEFMIKIYYQNKNLGIMVNNSKSSVVIFSRNIQLLIPTSIVIIDQELGMIHRFCCNHISFTQLCHNCSIPQFVCDISYFLVATKCFTSMKLLFTISFSTEETIWNEILQVNIATIDSNFNWIRLRRVFRCITKFLLTMKAKILLQYHFLSHLKT